MKGEFYYEEIFINFTDSHIDGNYAGFVCSSLNELNSKKNSGIFSKMRYNRGRKIPSAPIVGTLA